MDAKLLQVFKICDYNLHKNCNHYIKHAFQQEAEEGIPKEFLSYPSMTELTPIYIAFTRMHEFMKVYAWMESVDTSLTTCAMVQVSMTKKVIE